MGLILLGVVAVILLGGTFALLAMRIPVPDAIWAAWGVVITALFGHGTFLAQNATHARTVSDLLEAVQAGALAATPTVTTTTSNGPGRPNPGPAQSQEAG